MCFARFMVNVFSSCSSWWIKIDVYRLIAATRPTKLTRDAYVKLESVQKLVDLARESAKITKPVSTMDVVEYFFLDKARKDLGIVR